MIFCIFFFMNYKFFVRIKLVLLIVALWWASFLAFVDRSKNIAPDHTVIFVLDINKTMNTQDVLSGVQHISRLQAAKQLIKKTISSDAQFSYGLILFNASTDYLLPPTFDTWTFLLYLSWITTNLLPDWAKDFSQLSGLLHDKNTSYIILSDFDDAKQSSFTSKKWISLIGLWSSAGDKVRYANGVIYYLNGSSIVSTRNDTFAKSHKLPYMSLSTIDAYSPQKILFGGMVLPLSQRIFLYVVLWILVILVVLL